MFLRYCLAGALLCIANFSAQVFGQSQIDLSGFGTVGFAHTHDTKSTYRSGKSLDAVRSAGNFNLDSRFGLQATAEFSREISTTAQLVIRDGANGSSDYTLEWAFVDYLPTNSLSLRIGRRPLSTLMQSDYRQIGFANHSVRPFEETYSQLFLTNGDGIDIVAQTKWREIVWTFGANYAYIDQKFFNVADIKSRNALQVHMTGELGPLKARISRARLDMSVSSEYIDDVYDIVSQGAVLIPSLTQIQDDLLPTNQPLDMTAIGLSVDQGRHFAELEYVERRAESFIPSSDSWSFILGTRLGDFTPYAFVAELNSAADRITPLDLPNNPLVDRLNSALNQLFVADDQRSAGVGLRLDFATNVSLKVQIEEVSVDASLDDRLDTGIARIYNSSQPGNHLLTSIAFDFVF